jgi:hypothetical protein
VDELIVADAVFVTMAAAPEDAAPAEAMFIRDGRIAAVGSMAHVRAAAPGAEVVRCGGATIIPGLIDAHCHVTDLGYLAAAADCSALAAPDIATVQAQLRAAAGRAPEGSWVTGGGYTEYQLLENRHPTRDELDQAVPDRPAVLYHTSLHAAVLNSAALRESQLADKPARSAWRRLRPGQSGAAQRRGLRGADVRDFRAEHPPGPGPDGRRRAGRARSGGRTAAGRPRG